MSRWSLLLATLVAASYLGVRTAAVDVPAPILNKTNEASECIPPPAAGVEGRINYTATCVSPSGSVVWLIGDYTMVDRDQFKDEFYGVRIEDAHPNDSRMTLYPEGADFLLDSFGNRSFTIRCQTIVNEVNIRRSENLFTFYGGFRPIISGPEVTSVRKRGDIYTIIFTYQCPNMAESCVGKQPIRYSLDLSEGDLSEGSCSMTDACDSDGRMYWTCTGISSIDSLTASLTAGVGEDGFAPSFSTEIPRDSLTTLCAPPDEPDEFPAWLLAVVGIAAFAAGFAIVILPVALYICVRRSKNTQTSPKKQHSRLHSRNHADEEKRVAKHAEAVGHTETAP